MPGAPPLPPTMMPSRGARARTVRTKPCRVTASPATRGAFSKVYLGRRRRYEYRFPFARADAACAGGESAARRPPRAGFWGGVRGGNILEFCVTLLFFYGIFSWFFPQKVTTVQADRALKTHRLQRIFRPSLLQFRRLLFAKIWLAPRAGQEARAAGEPGAQSTIPRVCHFFQRFVDRSEGVFGTTFRNAVCDDERSIVQQCFAATAAG